MEPSEIVSLSDSPGYIIDISDDYPPQGLTLDHTQTVLADLSQALGVAIDQQLPLHNPAQPVSPITPPRRPDDQFEQTHGYGADAETRQRNLVSRATLTSNPRGKILVGTVPQCQSNSSGMFANSTMFDEVTRRVLHQLVAAIMEWLDATTRGEVSNEIEDAVIVAEKHEDGAWHWHWAIRCKQAVQLSVLRFTQLQTHLERVFGKHTWVKLGSTWPQLVRYYCKNVAPLGTRDAYFYSLYETVEEVRAAEANREGHKKIDMVERNKALHDAYTNGDLQNYFLNTGGLCISKADAVIKSIRSLGLTEPLPQSLKDRIKNTEVWWIHGASRTGKTFQAVNRLTKDEQGNQLPYLRLTASQLNGGFMNGYEMQQVVIIDEIDRCWGEAHVTLKTLQGWMDNYEGIINVKGGAVQKRVWRWVLISNYPPREVFATAPRGSNGQIDRYANVRSVGNLDMEGTYTPMGMRVTNNNRNPERCLCTINNAGENPSTGFGVTFYEFCWWSHRIMPGATGQVWGPLLEAVGRDGRE